jgi:hypothetical protein
VVIAVMMQLMCAYRLVTLMMAMVQTRLPTQTDYHRLSGIDLRTVG